MPFKYRGCSMITLTAGYLSYIQGVFNADSESGVSQKTWYILHTRGGQ